MASPTPSPTAHSPDEATAPVDWQGLVDSVVLPALTGFAASSGGRVETVYLTGSYLRGSWNRLRPNLNVYFVAAPGHAPAVRLGLGRRLHDVRADVRSAGADLTVDCHPYTVSQRDPGWVDRQVLTLTTKVLDGEARHDRYRIAPSIGLGWHRSYEVVFGPDMLGVFAAPPARDSAWLAGVHEALSHYRNILDHLPWALDWTVSPHRLLEESCRYAEEALRDGVHVGLDDEEVAAGENITILFDWASRGRAFYQERYGPAGTAACDTVARLKAASGTGTCTAAEAERAWLDALDVWSVVWDRYRLLARRMGAEAERLKVTAWL